MFKHVTLINLTVDFFNNVDLNAAVPLILVMNMDD